MTALKILFNLFSLSWGWTTPLQSHSNPIFLIQIGALLALDVRKSKLPPTPIANLIVPFFWEFMNLSWSGAPKLQSSRLQVIEFRL